MFHRSSQKERWLFKNGEELEQLRVAVNRTYCEKVGTAVLGVIVPAFLYSFSLCLIFQHAKVAAEKGVEMLTGAEEHILCQYFMKKLLEFCNVFEPRVPRSALVCR